MFYINTLHYMRVSIEAENGQDVDKITFNTNQIKLISYCCTLHKA